MPKDITAGQITKVAMGILESRNCLVWRSNNLPVPGRRFTGLKGVPDICGFHRNTGIAVYCEVKTINDRFSEYQIYFMTKAKKAGCITLVATEENGKIVINDFIID